MDMAPTSTTKILEQEISIIDFKSTSKLRVKFALDGSADSRPTYTEVEWANFCPDVFRILQDYAKVDNDDYSASICNKLTVKQILAHGKSGKFLRLTHDARFVIKIITKSEKKVFLDNLPSYYRYMRKYKNTSLLTKYYGLHSMKQGKAAKVYFAVMGNILHSNLNIHKHYNLKASQSRGTNTDSIVEDEHDIVFHLSSSVRDRLSIQLKRDCDFLEDIGVTEYNLLLGIHLITPSSETVNKSSSTVSHSDSRGSSSDAVSYNGSCSPLHLPSGSSTPLPSYIAGSCSPMHSVESGSCSSLDMTELKDIPVDVQCVSSQYNDQENLKDCIPRSGEGHDSSPPEEKLGCGLSARAVRKSLLTRAKEKDNNVVVYFEITNIFNHYTIGKRVEDVFKSLHSESISSTPSNPKAYSNRFQELFAQKFPDRISNGLGENY